jgi:hypothetical protein
MLLLLVILLLMMMIGQNLEDEEENQENPENQENHQIKRGNKEKLKEEDNNIFRKYQFLFYKCKFYKDII